VSNWNCTEPTCRATTAQRLADDDIGDDLLRLLFTSCHPLLPMESRVALTLRLLGGLSTPEIARAFLQPEPTVAQRIVRAKRTLAEKQVPFEVPRKAELPERLDAVLEVLYLVFNEGYAATSGDDWMRPALCEEALRLGRVLVGLLPNEAEALGLLALMELQASRMPARTRRTARRCCCPSRTARAGTACRSSAACRRWCVRNAWGAPMARTRCKPRWLPAMRARGASTTPTGPRSRRCTHD
jgi:predicted RNA polymerase sigma factor